jgi:hypothetical protein
MSKSPERKMLEWLKLPHIRPYALATLLTALTLVQSHFDPFGLISTTDHVSGLLVNTALAHETWLAFSMFLTSPRAMLAKKSNTASSQARIKAQRLKVISNYYVWHA